MRLLIYTPVISPRIKYIFNFIFREILHGEFEFTSIKADFIKSDQPKISYADTPVKDEVFFRRTAFLTQHRIEAISIETTLFGEQKVPFPVDKSCLPFDVFAASFYFISRYEEYLPFTPDQHQRYPAALSLQYQLNLLEKPIIDQWALILKNILSKKFPDLSFGKRNFNFIPTIDVDRAYHFRSNGLLKNTLRVAQAAIRLNTTKILDILSTGLGRRDPFDTYHYLAEAHYRYKVKPIFFFLLAKNGHQEFDQNINPNDEHFISLIKEISARAHIGIHPSYTSNADPKKISEELIRLQKITDKKVDSSRQHFLKLSLPKTYLQIIQAGINHDYTMGYASKVGFRAGTCTSFFWYDLQLEKQSHLKVHPFAVMDISLEHYLKLKPNEAIAKISELLLEVKLVNGTFCSIWHNESLSETGKWQGWKIVYEELLKHTLI